MVAEFSILTLNLRNVLDRYDERKLLLVSGFASLAPDWAAFQEVAFAARPTQDSMMAESVQGRRYCTFRARSYRYPEFGNSLLVGLGTAVSSEELRLSNGRCAIRSRVVFPGDVSVWFVTTHLHHRAHEPEVRLAQVSKIIEWMEAARSADACVVAGDFNALPTEPAVFAMGAAGYRSAFGTVNGREPDRTRPSGILAEGMDTEGEPGCVDYIWVSGNVEVQSCEVVFAEPAKEDPSLFASDHFGLLARVSVGSRFAAGRP